MTSDVAYDYHTHDFATIMGEFNKIRPTTEHCYPNNII